MLRGTIRDHVTQRAPAVPAVLRLDGGPLARAAGRAAARRGRAGHRALRDLGAIAGLTPGSNFVLAGRRLPRESTLVKTYGQYCPVARALEVVGDRWSLLIVRDLLLGDRGFNELERGLPGISRSLLAQRLRLLERGGVVTRELGEDGRARAYALTKGGRELAPLIDAARIWGGRWAFEDPRPGEIDPAWLLTSMLRRRKPAALPRRRIVVEFQVRGGRRPTVWLVLDPRGGSEVCLKDPGFPVDLVISAEVRALFRVWLGRLPRARGRAARPLHDRGGRELVRAFPGWFQWPQVPQPALRATSARVAGRPRRREVVMNVARLRFFAVAVFASALAIAPVGAQEEHHHTHGDGEQFGVVNFPASCRPTSCRRSRAPSRCCTRSATRNPAGPSRRSRQGSRRAAWRTGGSR